MNQYPPWKYLLILVVLVFGVIFALPNLYGKDPSLQISARRGNQPISEIRAEAEQALREEQIENIGVSEQENRVLIRFADTDTQAKAADVLGNRLGDDYVVALNLAPATPAWLEFFGAEPMVLGLDLQGGIHFLMQVDMVAAKKQAVERYVDDIRTTLRSESIRYRTVTTAGGAIIAKLRTVEDREKALDKIFEDLPELGAKEQAGNDSFDIRFTISEVKLQEIGDTALKQNITILRNRVNLLGVAEPIVQQQGSDRIVVQLPGIQDSDAAKKLIGAQATLEYRAVCQSGDPIAAAQSGLVPAGCRLYQRRNGQSVLLDKRIIVGGNQLIDASQGFDQETGSPQVNVTLDNVGAERMRQFTLDNVGNGMAVVYIERRPITREVDGETIHSTRVVEEVISVATIQSAFGKRFRTTGLDSSQEAAELALLLRAGALAAPMQIIEERSVGPSLGKDNVERGFNSVMIGFVLVLIFMAVYYRLFGLVADLALFANLVLIVALLSMLGATLTLPGIAGIVLTVGMAVDANVLIFERIREEIKNGNTPQASIRAGYEKAFSTIADANITTLIAAIVLFSFGTGAIKGFAVTLSLGIITSMFTAIMGTRAVINLIYGRQQRVKSLTI